MPFVVYRNSSTFRYTPAGHETERHKYEVEAFDTRDSAKLAALLLNAVRAAPAHYYPDAEQSHYTYEERT